MSEDLIPNIPSDEPESPDTGAPVSAEEQEPVEEELSFSEMLDEFERTSDKPETSASGVLRGEVVSVRHDGVFVDVGRKSEAFLPIPALKDGEPPPEDALKTGDTLEVSVSGRSPDGYLTLSRVIAQRPKNWTEYEIAFSEGTAIAGKVTGVIKGGLSVDIGVRAFMPASRSGTRQAEEMQALVGQEISCRITQLDVEDENVIVDRRVILEQEREEKRKERIAALQPGMVVSGTVCNIRDFGAFVDLGGVDGLLHVSDLSWSRVKDPASVLSQGQELQVKILKIDDGGKRISVGLKQLSTDPWTVIGEKLQPGDRIKGVVTKLMDFGAFVEIEPGVEGLIHISEMSWARKVRHPEDLLKAGEVVEAVVLEMKLGEHRIGLGLKQVLGDPWERLEKDFAPGTAVEATVVNLAKFGAFVEVIEGVEGLLHVSDITSERRLNHPSEMLKVGQKIRVVIIELDRDKHKLKLGMKQLERGDADEYFESCQVGDTVTGRVAKISGGKVVVELGDGLKGICQLDPSAAPKDGAPKDGAPKDPARKDTASKPADISSLSKMIESAWKGGGGPAPVKEEPLRKGQVRSFKVTALDPKSKSISLALK